MSAPVMDRSARLERVPGASPAEPAFIVGPARSGTSLLYKTLCLHPDVAYISNWVARYPALPAAAVLNRVAKALPDRRRTAWFADGANAYVYGSARSLARRSFPTPVEGEPVYARAGVERPGDGATRSVAPSTALPRAFGTIARFGGGSVFVSKRIANNLRIPLLADVFPSARFVFLVRDGRAVAASLSRVDWWPDSHVWWYGNTPRRWADEGRDPWEICARNWVEELHGIERGLEVVPPDAVLRLRYEDLVADPLPVLRRVTRFLGLVDDLRWERAVGSLSFPDRNDAWRGLPTDVVEGIETIQGEELGRYGYAR
jgi:omega-hydroxy-beta-dihydromenaquinone-9 sulfotransferase